MFVETVAAYSCISHNVNKSSSGVSSPTSPLNTPWPSSRLCCFLYGLHGHPHVLQSLHVRRSGIGGYHEGYLGDVRYHAQPLPLELPSVYQQHRTSRLTDHGALDLGL